MKKTEQQVSDLRALAKARRRITDEKIADACGISPGTLRNMASGERLHTLSFEAVTAIAKLAGKEIRFVDKE